MMLDLKLDIDFGNVLNERVDLGIEDLEARRRIDVARREVFIAFVVL